MPRISVVMAVHNGEPYVRESIESILGQTYRDFEFLIVNDASTDGTRELILSYADSRILLLENSENLGLTRSLNRGLQAARGEFIARQDADDISEPRRFEKQVAFLEAHPEVALLGSWTSVIDSQSACLDRMRLPSEHRDLRWEMFFSCPFVHSAVVLRRMPVLRDVGIYDETYVYAQDYQLWCRIADRFSVANLPEFLVRYRTHPTSMTSTYPDAAPEFSALRIARIAPRLDWKTLDQAERETRRAVMTALYFGWRLSTDPDRLNQAVDDILRLHSAFCEEEGLRFRDLEKRQAALRARISANLVMLAGFCVSGDLAARSKLLTRAYQLHPRVFLRPRTIARVGRVIGDAYLTGRLAVRAES